MGDSISRWVPTANTRFGRKLPWKDVPTRQETRSGAAASLPSSTSTSTKPTKKTVWFRRKLGVGDWTPRESAPTSATEPCSPEAWRYPFLLNLVFFFQWFRSLFSLVVLADVNDGVDPSPLFASLFSRFGPSCCPRWVYSKSLSKSILLFIESSGFCFWYSSITCRAMVLVDASGNLIFNFRFLIVNSCEEGWVVW